MYKRQGKKVADGEYLLASGTRAKWHGSSEWIAAAQVQLSGGRAVIREAEPIEFPAEKVTEEKRAQLMDGKVRGRAVKAVGAIELSETPVQLTPEEAAEALKDIEFSAFPLTEEEQRLKERLDFLHGALGQPWPDVEEGDYSVEVGEVAGGASIGKCDMLSLIHI